LEPRGLFKKLLRKKKKGTWVPFRGGHTRVGIGGAKNDEKGRK